jgi:N-methylhydantoinase A
MSTMTGAKGSGGWIGVDIGGTFTDLVLARPDGSVLVAKRASTPADPAVAVVEGIVELLRAAAIEPGAIAEVVHGTTVASNAILEKKGARTGLLTTRGFRDVLEIGRIRTPDLYDLTWDKPRPLVERALRLEVDERIGADGSIVRPLDPASVRLAAARLAATGVTSIAICLLNSYVNPEHERQAEAIVRAEHPGIDVAASYRVLPEIKEYERTSTTVVNAYLLPIMRRYLGTLAARLRALGLEAPLLVVASNGGVLGVEAAAERPVFAVGSGPAAGVAGAARLGAACGYGDLITFDMGGTTAKASLVEDGRVFLTSEYEFREGISTPSRFVKAGGYMLKVPAIDIAEVGAGAGSIAWLDTGGLLRVGPESAGASPGPACYGLGGERPTVTDANVVLGYLNPAYLTGGELKLDAERAEAAIRSHVAEPLGMSVVEAARGIRAVANAGMARAIRAVTIERGRDPRRCALIAFGGSGPVHAADVARALEITRAVVPISPGVFTALGMLASDLQHHAVRAYATPLEDFDPGRANAIAGDMAREALAMLAAEGYQREQTSLAVFVDLRYVGQGSELTVPLAGERVDASTAAALAGGFGREYLATYGYTSEEALEVVNLRMVATGHRRHRLDLRRATTARAHRRVQPSRRRVWFDRAGDPVDTAVVGWEAVGATPAPGPLVVESYDSTVVVPPGATVRADGQGNLEIDLGGA